MPIERRPDQTLLVRLEDDPQFSACLDELFDAPPARPAAVVLEFAGVRYLNSSNLAKVLRLRKNLIEEGGRLALCAMSGPVMSVFHATGLDKVFVITKDVESAALRVRPA